MDCSVFTSPKTLCIGTIFLHPGQYIKKLRCNSCQYQSVIFTDFYSKANFTLTFEEYHIIIIMLSPK